MTEAEARRLADHAATVWPDVLADVWAARLMSSGWEFATARNALSRLRVSGGAATLADLAREVAALTDRGPCPRCGGSRFITEERPPTVLFATDATVVPATVIDDPDVPRDAPLADVARAYVAAIRAGRDRAQVVQRERVVHVTARCPDCTALVPKEPA